MRFGWDRFVKDPATLLVPVIVGSIVQGIVLTFLFFGLLAAMIALLSNQPDSAQATDAPALALLIGGVLYVIVFAAFQIVYAGWLNGGLAIVAGQRPTFAELYAGWSKANVFLVALVLCGLIWLGSFLWWVPSIAVLFVGQFSLHHVLDRDANVVDALTASARLVVGNLVQVALFDLLAVAAMAVGTLLCGVGSFVAAPVVIIASAYTYRALASQTPG